MPKKIFPENGGVLINWLPGESGNPAGRPRKFVSKIKGIGYRICEARDTLLNLLAMNTEELESIAKDGTYTILEQVVAKSLLRSLKKSDISTIEILLSRISIKIEITDDEKDKIIKITSMNSLDASKEYSEIMK